MRVIFYAYEFHPLGGGVGKAVKELFQQFQNYDDVEIDFVTTSLSGRFEKTQFSDNITFHRLPIGKREEKDYHVQKPWHMVAYTLLAYFYTWKLIFTKKYDLTHFFGYPGGVASLLFAWRLPYVISLRGIDVPGYNKSYGAYYLLFKPLSKVIWKFARKVIANSSALAELANETLPSKKIDIIPNGIDCEKFKPVPEGEKFKKFTITAGGTLLGKRKGLDQLIRGFADFAKNKKDVELMLYASGQEEENLRSLAKELKVDDKVVFRGRVENTVISEELPKAHLFCLPSLNEGMANAALEALASGLPMLLTETGGTKELLKEGKNGFIIKKGEHEDIAQYLNQLYLDKDLRIRMGETSRERGLQMSWENVARSYREVYLGFAK